MLRQAHAVPVTVLAILASPAPGGVTIPTFTNETASRLSAAAGVGSADTSEKDYAIGDFDQDGDDDVAVGRRVGLNNNADNPLPNTLFINENGVLTDLTASLAPAMLSSRRTRDVVAADFNADGWLDLLVADGTSLVPQLLVNQGEDAGEWLGFAENTTAIPAAFLLDAWSVAAGDLANDNDAYPDVFFGTRTGNDRVLINLGTDGTNWLGFSDGSTRLGTNATTAAVRSSEVVDINLDGDEDIIQVVTNPTGACRILANDGTGMFTTAPQSIITGACYNFATGDLDGDGRRDFFGVRNSTDQFRTNTGNGAGDLITLGTAMTAQNSSGFGSIVRVADINDDGTDDFLVCDLDQEFPQDCTRRLKFHFNSGVSPFLTDGYPAAVAWTPLGTSDVAPLDIDGDGDLDLLIGHCSGNSIYMQDGAPPVFGDLDDDGIVGFQDLLALLAAWGPCAGCPADLNGDGDVGFGDVLLLLAAWTV